MSFSAICLSETLCQLHETSYSILQIPSYVSLNQTKKSHRGGRPCILLLESFSCKVRYDLAVNPSTIECLCVEVFNNKSKSLVLNLSYWPLNGDDSNELENHLKTFFQNGKLPIKNWYWLDNLILKPLTWMNINRFKILWILCFDMAWFLP